jgi:hypothetical protein
MATQPPRLLLLAPAAACVVLACSSGSSFPPSTSTGGTGGATTTSATGGAGTTTSGSATGGTVTTSSSTTTTSATTTTSTTTSTTSSTTGTGGSGPSPVCAPGATWSAGSSLSVSVPAGGELAAVTADELTIAWVSGSPAAAVVRYADRAHASDAFGAPSTLPTSAQGAALDRVALSADGLRLGVVRGDRRGFVEFTRPDRSAAFTEQGEGTFANVNQLADAFTTGMAFGDPVLAPDDHHFFFSIYGGSEAVTLQATMRVFAGESWGMPVGLDGPELEVQGTHRRRATGVSPDNLTLFFWDEVTGTERAGYRGDGFSTFTVFVDLGDRAGAAPNAACDALYYFTTSGGSVDLRRAARN